MLMGFIKLRSFILLVAAAVLILAKPVTAQSAEKVGVLVVGAGEGTTYDPRWLYGYYEHLFPFWPAGFFAGRTGWEGEACYTQVHFANEEEALICGVPEGSVIDVFCEVHPEWEGTNPATGAPYAVGIFREAYFLGGGPIRTERIDDGVVDDNPTILYTLLGSETDNPSTDWRDDLGVHVDDPSGPGIGIDDFTEQGAFNMMETHAVHFSALNHENPYTGQIKEWVYGAGGTTNIEDEVNAAIAADPTIPAGTTVVFRDASEAFVENKDMHGNHVVYPDSVETAFDEMINDEGVDRVVVFSLASSYANVINYGPYWRDANGDGVSVIPGKTYAECIEDVSDGYGPATAAERDALIAEKPWDMYKTIMREADLINADRVPLSFTQNYGTSSHYDQAALDVLAHAVAKYSIPDTAALKVVVASHGYAGGWRNGAECDSYFRTDPIQAARIQNSIETNFAWNGKLTVVPGPVEFAQPGEGANYDPPSAGSPFGQTLGAGEQVDMSIKGSYVNELGNVVDNGTAVTPTNALHDYVIVIPLNWDGEGVDTLTHARPDILGNMEAGTVEGNIDTYVRQHEDHDGTEYGEAGPLWPYHDSENYTHRVMDGLGWCTEAADTTVVCRGTTDPNPTEVIITGTILSHPDGDAREAVTLAATEVIIGAIKDPDVGGYDDTPYDPLPVFDNEPTTSGSQTALSTDSQNPTTVGGGELIYWWYTDETLNCTENTVAQWQYREAGSGDPFSVVDLPDIYGHPELNYAMEAWGGNIIPSTSAFTGYTRILGGGTFEMQLVLTDCAGQTVTSQSYYFTVDLEPQINKEPTAYSNSGPLIVLGTDIGNPAAVTEDHLLYWWIADDEATCSEDMASSYKYRTAGSSDAWTVISQPKAGTGGIPFADAQNGVGGVLSNSTPFTGWASMFGAGTWEIRQVVTDCAGSTVTGDTYYFSVTN